MWGGWLLRCVGVAAAGRSSAGAVASLPGWLLRSSPRDVVVVVVVVMVVVVTKAD